MLAQALRYASWGENIAVKLPTVKAALPVIEELAARGIAVCTTLNFSVSQALAAGEAYERGAARARAAGVPVRPCFAVQQGGRLDEYLWETAQDNGIDVPPEDISKAGNAVCKKAYRLFRERGITATIMPAGLRGVHHLAAMAGADVVFSLQARVQRLAIEADLPRVERIDEEVPAAVVETAASHPRVRAGLRRGRAGPGGVRDLRGHAADPLPVPLDGLGSARDLRRDGHVRPLVLRWRRPARAGPARS